ncbi:MAG: bifunctional UDP-N-acetylglucosamine diphosphorylase/glucosamine-1-phosphate N-acetyltransferase GlmU [Paenibacillaceae bacterium]|nr:bifunctional UDP-N-acetylglucosamine diphosphorylase/glucosamine-1-phosphate N-acetyltransferase GlmU [Paenibacillaceae bacterium]
MSIYSIVLAAGQGKRMKSKLYKVLHPVCGKPMVGHVATVLERLESARPIVVVGHGADAVRGYLGDRAEYALQERQLGTGHAAMQAAPLLAEADGLTIVVYGDTPLITEGSLRAMIALHREKGASATILTAIFAEPHGFGRIVRDADGNLDCIVEQKDCTAGEAAIREINVGTYIFDNRKLFAALSRVTNDNAQQEYYLTDVIGILQADGERVLAYCTADPSEAIGVNDRAALADAEKAMRERINRAHMLAGVTIVDAAQTYIEADVTIGSDTVILPGCLLRGATSIGEDCVIGPQADIADSVVADRATIRQSVLTEAEVGADSSVGPFAYLRPKAKLGEQVKIGDFVEIKNATLGDGSKVSHLSYVGDAVVGRNVNFGCGAITVNYDGFNKQVTEIGDDAFVGSNVNLIAPVKIGDGAYVVAGSTITHDVGAGDMAIARERQTNKAGYAEKLRNRFKAKKQRG